MKVVALQNEPGAVIISVIEGDVALGYWPILKDHFQASLEVAHDDMTHHNLLAMIMDGSLMLLVIHKDLELVGSACLEVVQLRKHKVLHCMHFAGDDLDAWADEWMITWKLLAKELGCDRITIKGREGWAKYARALGFEHTYTVMHYDLGDEQ